jgi:putative membrane protein (TIGR04086 family)
MQLCNIPLWILTVLADILWCVGSFVSGRRAGLHNRRHGIRTGAVCGAVLVLLLLCGCCIAGELPDVQFGVRCGLLVLSGCIGGIVGVNTKITRPPD